MLIFTTAFFPNVGGIETATQRLAESLAQAGANVTVMTSTPSEEEDAYRGFSVSRRPKLISAMRLHARADIVVHQQPSLKWAPLAVLLRKRLVVFVHIWLDEGTDVSDRIKRFLKQTLLRRAADVIFVSETLAQSINAKGRVIHNAYDESVFVNRETPRVRNSLIFVGRLIEDKGAEDAILATSELLRSGQPVSLTVVGDGPQRRALEALVAAEGISGSVSFTGLRSGRELNAILNSCEVAIFPSRWREPFGIVALEAMGAGCRIVVTDNGGLVEATGGLAFLVPPRNPSSLAAAVADALRGGGVGPDSPEVHSHLAQHSRSEIGHLLQNEILGATTNTRAARDR